MRYIITSLFLLLLASPSKAQRPQDFDALSNVFSPKVKTTSYTFARGLNANEYIWVMSRLFLLYKNNISTQDNGACNFAPSCSEYAMISVKELGLIKGVLNGFDRLLRCHPGARGAYPIDKNNLLKLADPFIPIK